MQTGKYKHGRAKVQNLLSQSGPALSAYMPVDVAAQIFVAWGASPVQGAKTDKGGNDQDLRYKDSILRESSEEIITLIEQDDQ